MGKRTLGCQIPRSDVSMKLIEIFDQLDDEALKNLEVNIMRTINSRYGDFIEENLRSDPEFTHLFPNQASSTLSGTSNAYNGKSEGKSVELPEIFKKSMLSKIKNTPTLVKLPTENVSRSVISKRKVTKPKKQFLNANFCQNTYEVEEGNYGNSFNLTTYNRSNTSRVSCTERKTVERKEKISLSDQNFCRISVENPNVVVLANNPHWEDPFIFRETTVLNSSNGVGGKEKKDKHYSILEYKCLYQTQSDTNVPKTKLKKKQKTKLVNEFTPKNCKGKNTVEKKEKIKNKPQEVYTYNQGQINMNSKSYIRKYTNKPQDGKTQVLKKELIEIINAASEVHRKENIINFTNENKQNDQQKVQINTQFVKYHNLVKDSNIDRNLGDKEKSVDIFTKYNNIKTSSDVNKEYAPKDIRKICEGTEWENIAALGNMNNIYEVERSQNKQGEEVFNTEKVVNEISDFLIAKNVKEEYIECTDDNGDIKEKTVPEITENIVKLNDDIEENIFSCKEKLEKTHENDTEHLETYKEIMKKTEIVKGIERNSEVVNLSTTELVSLYENNYETSNLIIGSGNSEKSIDSLKKTEILKANENSEVTNLSSHKIVYFDENDYETSHSIFVSESSEISIESLKKTEISEDNEDESEVVNLKADEIDEKTEISKGNKGNSEVFNLSANEIIYFRQKKDEISTSVSENENFGSDVEKLKKTEILVGNEENSKVLNASTNEIISISEKHCEASNKMFENQSFESDSSEIICKNKQQKIYEIKQCNNSFYITLDFFEQKIKELEVVGNNTYNTELSDPSLKTSNSYDSGYENCLIKCNKDVEISQSTASMKTPEKGVKTYTNVNRRITRSSEVKAPRISEDSGIHGNLESDIFVKICYDKERSKRIENGKLKNLDSSEMKKNGDMRKSKNSKKSITYELRSKKRKLCEVNQPTKIVTRSQKND